jgi:hypothetical protein
MDMGSVAIVGAANCSVLLGVVQAMGLEVKGSPLMLLPESAVEPGPLVAAFCAIALL